MSYLYTTETELISKVTILFPCYHIHTGTGRRYTQYSFTYVRDTYTYITHID